VPLAAAADVPAELSAAIERCLAKEREARWRTGRELADALSSAPRRRRWFGAKNKAKHTAANTLLKARVVTELAMFAAALKAVIKWATV